MLPAVREAMAHHYSHCELFRRFCEARGFNPAKPLDSLLDVPYFPVTVFKRLDLRSTDDIIRVLNSSATSSQTPSRIALDNITRNRQMRVLAAILGDVIGASRRPFIVLDAPPSDVRQDNGNALALSARIAGMRGYLLAASEIHYVLSDVAGRPVPDIDKLRNVAAQFVADNAAICVLAYTYILYKYVVRPLYDAGIQIELPPSAFVLHFGGWKRLQDEAVDKATLNRMIGEVFKIPRNRIRDIFGFTEQLGIIYPDDENGVKRTPVYSEVIVRDPMTLLPVSDGQPGLLQFLTPLPHSYPGVSVLLDDMGRIITREPSEEGRYGTGFEIIGRAVGAEIRGCGDTLPTRVYEVTGP